MAILSGFDRVGPRDGLWARALNLLLGSWILVSAFAWEHGAAQTSAALVGYFSSIASVAAMLSPKARRCNALLSAWLFLSAWLLPHAHAAARWNEALVAIAMFSLSLVPGHSRPPSGFSAEEQQLA